MKTSVCITVLNEENSISELLEGLLGQSQKPDEIVIVDGGSSDKTVELIRHFQKKDQRIKLLVEKCSRARGRNLGVEMAGNDIIAMTDAGCIPKKDWLKIITEPFRTEGVDIAAGFYNMKTSNPLEKAFSIFLGTHPKDFDINFLPSTRSIAFRRQAWEKIGGFPQSQQDTAEDTVFNYNALKAGLNFARVKNARVEWGMSVTLLEFFKKVFKYAKGDAKSGIWLHPSKGLASHNIKAFLIFARYTFGLLILFLSLDNAPLFFLLLLYILLYIIWSFRKVYLKTGDLKAGLLGIIIQFASDFAVMTGFISGIITINKK